MIKSTFRQSTSRIDLSMFILAISGSMLCVGCATKSYWDQISGMQYKCSHISSEGSCITLPTVREDCKVLFQPGESIPPEYSDKVMIRKDDMELEIHGPKDIEGCVYLWSASDALAYLRFFSSYYTVHLFTDQKLEIYSADHNKGCIGVCLPRAKWNALRFTNPNIVAKGIGYEITRYIIKPLPKPFMPTIFKEIVFVSRYGLVELVNEEEISSDSQDTEGLFFPQYL